jgi:hypothetical protein
MEKKIVRAVLANNLLRHGLANVDLSLLNTKI